MLNWKLTWKADWFARPTGQNWIASLDFCFYLPGKVFASQWCTQDTNSSETSQHCLGISMHSLGWKVHPNDQIMTMMIMKYYHMGGICRKLKQKSLVLWGWGEPSNTQSVVPATGLSRTLAPGDYLWDNFAHIYSGYWQTQDNSA